MDTEEVMKQIHAVRKTAKVTRFTAVQEDVDMGKEVLAIRFLTPHDHDEPVVVHDEEGGTNEISADVADHLIRIYLFSIGILNSIF